MPDGKTQPVSGETFVDNRPASIAQRKLIEAIGSRAQASAEPVAQAQFQGPQFNNGNAMNNAYNGHQFTNNGVKGNTGCGIDNRIVTAGEQKNSKASKPGTPTNMRTYASGYARTGGLVRDKTLGQASTRMHLINHRLENSGNTQGNAGNIFLGTKNANNPRHLHEVENVVINALQHSTRRNADYETAMGNAMWVPDLDNGNVIVPYWDQQRPLHRAVRHQNLEPVYVATPGNPGGGIQDLRPVKMAKGTGQGWALRNTAGLDRHLWLRYNVQVAYGGVPNHINQNVLFETGRNVGNTLANQQRAQYINAFTGGWGANAQASSFTCSASYYYATYAQNSLYYRDDEGNHTIPADA